MTANSAETQIFSGQLVAQSMPIPISTGQIVVSAAHRGTANSDAPLQGTETIKSNPNMVKTEKFGGTKTLEDSLSMLDPIAAAARGR